MEKEFKKGLGLLQDIFYYGVIRGLHEKLMWEVDSGKEHDFLSDYPKQMETDIIFGVSGNKLRDYFREHPLKGDDYVDPHPCCC